MPRSITENESTLRDVYPCKERSLGCIKADIRGLSPQDVFSFCVGYFGRKQPTFIVPHGIGGEAIHVVGVVIVGSTVVVDITKIVGIAGVYRKRPILFFFFDTSINFSIFRRSYSFSNFRITFSPSFE